MYLGSTVLAVPVLPIVWCFPDLLLLVCVCLWSSNYCSISILPVPAPGVSVFHFEGATAFAGSQLTLTCNIVLDSTLSLTLGDLDVTRMWSGPGSGMLSSGGRITVSPASRQGLSTTFTSQVLFNTLRTSDAGTYTCQATVAPRGSTAGTVTNGVGSANTATPTIQGTCMYINFISCVCYSLVPRPFPGRSHRQYFIASSMKYGGGRPGRSGHVRCHQVDTW